MTDVLDRMLEPEAPSEPAISSAPPVPRPASGRQSTFTVSDPGSVLFACLSGAAGVIHFVMVPSHMGEWAVEGVTFAVAGWFQLVVALLMLRRPSRALLGVTLVANVAFIAAWIASRTSGFPVGPHAGHAETVSVVDLACVGLELSLVAVASVFLLSPRLARGWRNGNRFLSLGLLLAVLALTTFVITSPEARNHAHASHAGHGGGGAGHSHGAGDAQADDLGFAALANGQMGSHQHPGGPKAAGAEIDPQTAAALAGQLALTAPLVEAYPTLADARAAGYRQAGPFSPGLGTHYTGGSFTEGLNLDGDMDPADIAAPTLIYDGLDADAPLAGFMYMAYQDTEPEGFVGPLDKWHFHTAVCMVITPDGVDTPFGADLTGVTDEMCTSKGGTMIDFTGYMVHVWTVPGYESDLGTFSDLNPKITCPDGTYHVVPTAEIGDADSTCVNP